ncbi:MAG: AAA family ATPase [Ignavibacteria bacterium]|nr:AAA family ATPase [Ignavibacteria bacterium]
MNKIIAVVGLCGSGKSEAVKFFTENGYSKVYFGEIVLDELKTRGLEVNEQNEKLIREELRKQFGMGVMALKSLNKIRELFKKGNVVIESLYSWTEYKIIKSEFGDAFKLLALHTPKSLRYKRLSERDIRPLTEEESIRRDISEIENIEKAGPIAFADYLVINDGTIEELREKLKTIL